MMTRERTLSGHTFRLTVTRRGGGWTVRKERDSEVVRTQAYTDWHRVERAIYLFELEPARQAAAAEPV